MYGFKNIAYGVLCTLAFSACGADEVGFLSGPASPQKTEDALPYFVKEWQSGESQTQTIAIDTGFGLIKQGIQLSQEPRTVETSRQINRPIQTVELKQGNDGDEITEAFAVAEAGLLDLLIVVDDSESMAGYQQKLGESLPNILTHIGNTNWRIAVATTSDPCLRQTNTGVRILTRTMYEADPEQSKQELIKLISVAGVNSYERGILMGTDALKGVCGSDTTPWLRPSANIAMLIVTDEENCGSASNEGCSGDAWETASYFTDEFGTEPTVHGLLLLEDPAGGDPTCEDSGYYEDPPNPTHYIDLITQTGGLYDDICTSDYDSLLQQISQKVSDRVNVRFALTYPPANGLTVDIDGTPVGDFEMDQSTLTINDPVDVSMETLTVTYRHTPVAKTKNYSTGVAADTSTLTVWVNDQKVNASEYSYNSATGQVEFNELPPDRARVTMIFRENTSLETEFAYINQSVGDSMEVRVNGTLASFTRNVAQKTIILDEAPADNSVVEISYERPGDKKESYEMLTALGELEEVKAEDKDTGDEVAIDIVDGLLVIEESADIWDGRNLEISYNLQISDEELNFKIPSNRAIDPKSLSIVADGDSEVCAKDLQINSSNLSFSCSDEDFEKIEIAYNEVLEKRNSFTLDFDYSGPVEWRVFINDKPTEDYFRFDQTVVIPFEKLGSDSTVRIEAEPIKDLEKSGS